MATTPSATHAGASTAIVGWRRLSGVVLMAGAPAVFWGYVASFGFGIAGIALSTTALAAVIGAIFLFLVCVVAGLAVAR
jgi:hypothetical protein